MDIFPVPTSGSRPYTITAGPDGNLWFTESNGNKIGRITPDGDITEFPVPTSGSGPYGIATGADGNIWFTERFADAIGRLDPETGEIDEFPIRTPFAQPWEIAAGPDGNLWFTETDAVQIGRITLNGSVTEFPAGSCCFPIGIAAGPDGNLWFTMEIGDQIIRMTPSGQATVFQIPTELQLLPWDITPGPDGNLWFTELAGRHIGRITTEGVLDRFPVEGDFSGIAGIAAGPDGHLWFTENDTSRLGAMRTDGVVLGQQDTQQNSRPLSIVHGPDGHLWFTMADGNAIGRINRAQRDTQYVLSMDAGFAPAVRDARLGQRVQWTFVGPREHGVRDASGAILFDSGPLPIVSYFDLNLVAAGTFVYLDSEDSNVTGAIRVPVRLPATGNVGEPFTVRWAMRDLPAVIVFDVQVKTPGAADYETWQAGVNATSAQYTPTEAGEYRFRARVRRGANATEFSPAAGINVDG